MTELATVPFGPLLRRLRIVTGLSQEELAERSGLSERGISALETGHRATPRPETVRLLADALELDAAARAALVAAARPELAAGPETLPAVTTPARPGASATLPLLPTRLIGREVELESLADLLAQDGIHLVTLTGPGGTGKTHLALQVAASVQDCYQDGVVFVDLSAITDSDLVLPAIATALGVHGTADAPLQETLIRYLRERVLLLLLDNCEQVLESASDIATLLAACPNLSILATSRESLHIRAEREIAVAPLPLPEPGRLLPLADLERVAAVALLLERARAARADFALTAENAAAVAGICLRLDGLPLAIELAAARIKVLPPAALLDRLEKRLPLLTGGGRDLPTRQRTMRDAVAWSYDLLAAEQQGLFRQLAIFAGGCALEAAEAVAGQEGAVDVFAGIAALVESSLLRQEEDRVGEARFRMLETVREYGLEQLALAGEADAARQRHAEYFQRLVESQVHGIPLFVTMERVTRLAADQDNLRLALAWFDERNESDTLLQVSTALYSLWLTQGLYREGLQTIMQALERADPMPSRSRVDALVTAGMLAHFPGDYVRAAAFSAEGLALARELGDPFLVAEALAVAGFVSYRRGEYGQAEDQLEEALRLFRGVGETVPNVVPEVAINLILMADTALALADTALAQRQFDRAAARYTEAFEAARAVSALWTAIDAQTGLAAVHYCTGNPVQAAARYKETLDQAQEASIALLVASALLGIAGIAAESGHPEEGARLLGAAEGSAASLSAPIFPRDRPVRDRCIAALMATLGEDRLAAAREMGHRLPVEQAVAQAKAVAQAVRPADQPGAALPGRPDERLTRRQVEVLRLMARWQTDREIAEALFMSPRTASWHVHTILEKLGAQSRGEAVDRARAAGVL
jgi:non-specific serine/threonine protein kinase